MPAGLKNSLVQVWCIAVLLLTGANLKGQVQTVSGGKFSIVQNGTTLSIPFESNEDIDSANTGLKYLVLSLHGTNRNSDDYYDRMVTAASIAGDDGDSTLIIAPQFLIEDDIDAFSLPTDYIYWSSGGWKAGSLSRDETSNPRPERISSYAILDSLISRVQNSIPSITYITLVGHSAGGQVVQRYAATSPLTEIIDSKMRFIVMNPSSYVYLDNKRRVNGTVDQFQVPTTGCSTYNEWKYGLEDLFSYPSNMTIDVIRTNYRTADVMYILGGADNDPNASGLDKDCEAELQGSHRLERGTIFFNHLKDHYGASIHLIDTVPGIGHSSSEMFSSERGVFHIFQSVRLDNITTSVFDLKWIEYPLSVNPNPVDQMLIINSPSETAENIDYFIGDISGRVVRSFSSSESQFEIDVSNFAPGFYIVRCEINGKIFRSKIAKL